MSMLESQIETRARLDAQMSERAYAELASAISDSNVRIKVPYSTVEQSDAAVIACLQRLGVEPGEVPSGITDVWERIEWMCRPSGTMYRNVTLDAKWYTRAIGVLLGTLDTGEPVALLPRGVRGYNLYEPETEHAERVNEQVASHIQPEALYFYRPLPARSLTMSDLMGFIARVFSFDDYKLVFTASLFVTLMGLFPAWANNIAFGTVVPSGSMSLIMPIAALLFGVIVSTTITTVYRNLVMARVSAKLDVAVEAATFARVLSLPTTFFKKYSSGDLANRVSNMTILSKTLVSILLGSLLSALLSLTYVLQIGLYTPVLMIPALTVIVAQAVLTVFVTLVNMRYERLTMEATAKNSGLVTALLNGIQKIKLAGAEDRAFAKWAHGYATYARAAYNRPPLLRALPALVGLIGILGNVVIYYLAGSQSLSVADYMAFNTAYGQAVAAITTLASAAGQVAKIPPMLQMVEPLMAAQPEIADDKPNVQKLSGDIEISDVAFRYNETGPYVLKNLSFRIHAGEYVALVGRSGCGKSTVLRLLLGFEKPERGSIFYGPYDVEKVNLRSLRSNIGVVMQDGKLFMGDIASNITISTPSATLEDTWRAAELAGIADDIRKMPMGMHTLVTEGGGGVSGGQRQRLMIARAICGNRKILMFDEATSALDNITQKHVSESLDQLNCTRLVIAHRLSTVRHCDRILVLDDGTIAEEGTYDELLAKNGLFAELVARQRLDLET